MNNLAVLHAIVTQLTQSIGSENALIIQKIQLRITLGIKYAKLKKPSIIKGLPSCCMRSMQASLAPSRDVNST